MTALFFVFFRELSIVSLMCEIKRLDFRAFRLFFGNRAVAHHRVEHDELAFFRQQEILIG